MTSVTLRDISAFITKGATPTTYGFEWEMSGVPFLRSECVSEQGLDMRQSMFISPKADQALRRSRVQDGDILMTITGYVGRVIRLSGVGSANINQHIARIRVKDRRFDPGYVYHYLSQRTMREYYESIVTGQAYPQISLAQVRDTPIPAVALSEQRAISSALDHADDLILALERLIAKKLAIKQGLMLQLLTGRARLPGFNGEWHDVKLGDHVTYVKTVALSRAQLDQTSPLRYLHYGDIHTRSAVTLDARVEAMPRAESRLAARAGVLRLGDLVFADASEDPAGVGKSVEITGVPEEGVVPGLHTIAARFDKSLLADGFKAYLQFIPAFRDALLRLAAGTKVLATTRSYISSITLSLPDVAEQQAIAVVLQDCEAEIEALHARLAKARAIKTGMMQQLLTGRTRLPVEAAS